MKLIDKDALVAEIERMMAEEMALFEESLKDDSHEISAAPVVYTRLQMLLSAINTLEVKEVDLEHLEQEVKDFCYKFDDRKDKWYDMTPHDKNIMISPTWSNFAMQLAKHFFELGMQVSNKAQKVE